MKHLFTLLLLVLFTTFLTSQTVNIEGDPYGGNPYANIPAAIATASAGDVILITGVHTTRVTINKAITLRGTDPTTDVIQAHANPGSATGRTMTINNIGNGMVTIENLTIKHGNANGGNGAGVFIDKVTGLATFNNVIIENNTTSRNGGGASILGSNVAMNFCTIRNNSTTSTVNQRGNGGGLHIVTANAAGINPIVSINNSTINNNSAARNGGAFYLNGNNGFGDRYILNVEFNNSTMGLNDAGNFGGSGHVMAADVVAGGGNPVGVGNINLTMKQVTIARNTATPGDNFGLFFSDGGSNPGPTFNLYNSIVVSAGLPGNRAINFDNSNSVDVINNVVGGQIFMNMIANKVNNIFGRTAGQAGIPAGLSNQGGLTEVFAIPAGSLPVDYATAPTGVPMPEGDQRGADWPRVSPPDAGAFEEAAVQVFPPVPTMGEWALFIFFLMMLNIGSVFVLAAQQQMTLAGHAKINIGTSFRSLPFDRMLFNNALRHAFGLAAVGFAFIYLVWGAIVPADFIGMAVSIPLAAYFIHLFLKTTDE